MKQRKLQCLKVCLFLPCFFIIFGGSMHSFRHAAVMRYFLFFPSLSFSLLFEFSFSSFWWQHFVYGLFAMSLFCGNVTTTSSTSFFFHTPLNWPFFNFCRVFFLGSLHFDDRQDRHVIKCDFIDLLSKFSNFSTHQHSVNCVRTLNACGKWPLFSLMDLRHFVLSCPHEQWAVAISIDTLWPKQFVATLLSFVESFFWCLVCTHNLYHLCLNLRFTSRANTLIENLQHFEMTYERQQQLNCLFSNSLPLPLYLSFSVCLSVSPSECLSR